MIIDCHLLILISIIIFHFTLQSSHITSFFFIHLYKIFSIKSTCPHTFKKLKFKKKNPIDWQLESALKQSENYWIAGWSEQWWSGLPSAAVFPAWRRVSESSAEKRRTRCPRLARARNWDFASAGISSDITVGTVPTWRTIRSSATWS